ncbi:MAG: hydroxyacid dehydrogenase [Synergistetes bacterium]|nr:hydroxyacid dehydrogenase [Synergistota bacterium]
MKNGNNLRIAIVNSSSFGRVFQEHIKELTSFGRVERYTFPNDIKGEVLARELRGVHVVIASVMPNYTRRFFENQKDVFLITRHGIGVNNVDIAAATEFGVLVTRVQGEVEREAMAEHTVTLMLSVLRQIPAAREEVKRGGWKNRARFVGMELRGKKVGIIGIGNIGSRVAEILKVGFGAEVLAYDPKFSSDEVSSMGAVLVEFDELLKCSDIITLHAPLTDETYHMLGEREFERMKDGVVIIDTARGELIDTESLIKSLRSKKVFGVGMDVVEGEPIGENHPLLEFDNVVIVPHIGAYTVECLKGMGDKVVDDVRRVLNGVLPDGIVNADVLKRRNRLNEFGVGG